MEKTGVTVIDVLRKAWMDPFTTKSDYARLHAATVAMAASDGYLTTKIATGLYSNQWQITELGLAHYNRMMGGFSV